MAVKRVAIVQSNYIPWKGYFDLIDSVDEFVFLDDVQFTKRDWRNRNLIKTPNGVAWLSVPVATKGKYFQTIQETAIAHPQWAHQHWQSLVANYSSAPHFDEVAKWLHPLYSTSYSNISELNRSFLTEICNQLQINTKLRISSEFECKGQKTTRLVEICTQAGADVYVTGPSAWEYLDPEMFGQSGLSIETFTYDGYQPYPQLWGEFEHRVSVLDVLFNCGQVAADYIFRHRA